MAEDDSLEFLDRNMREYKLRTAYGGLIKKSRHRPPKYDHVRVADSDGCCSSKDTNDKTHPKINSTTPVSVRPTDDPNRTKKSNPQRTNIQSTGQTTNNYPSPRSTVPIAEKKSCCCCCC